jgi:hypothetical protein
VGLLGAACLATGVAFAQHNPGDPLFCQPNEGNTFLIVNGGSGVFTVDGDCYGAALGSIPANTPPSTIATAHGTLTLANPTFSGGQANYVYAPSPTSYTGTDTFSITVSTAWNAAGGTGSAGGSARPGSTATMAITLNVIPGAISLAVPVGTATQVPMPASAVTGCGAPGNPGKGPAPGDIPGCITAIIVGFVSGVVPPSHGTLTVSGSTLLYTPTGSYTGNDTFTYQARGVNTDGQQALSSGNVTVTVTVAPPSVPTLGVWGMALLIVSLMLLGTKALNRRTA